MPLSIPPSHKAILGKISQLDAKERSDLLETLSNMHVKSLSIERLAVDLSEASDLSNEESQDFLSVIANLHFLSLMGALERSEVVPEVLRTIEGDKKIGASKAQLKATGQFLKKALQIRSFELLSKALHLHTGHERLLSKAKVFTDIRPIFGNGVDKPAAFVLSHTLRLTVYRGPTREAEEIYVSFDKTDLKMLLEVVGRARAKQESLEEFSRSSGIDILAPEEE